MDMKTEKKWISVEDSLPEDEITDRSDSETVLTFIDGQVELMHRSFIKDGDGYYEWIDIVGDICSPTHWMKLPFPPTAGEFKKQEVVLAVEKLRDDIEKQSDSMDLIKDSEFIQILGSIIGRLNLILNQS